MKNTRRFGMIAFCCMSLMTYAAGLPFTLTLDKPTPLYSCGEKAALTVKVNPKELKEPAKATAELCISKELWTVLRKENLDLKGGKGSFSFSATLREPGMLRFVITGTVDGRGIRQEVSAAYEPEKIKPGMEAPADLDAFWEANFKELASVPADFQRKPYKSDKVQETFVISCRTVNGKRAWGFLSLPLDKSRTYPVNFTIVAAGPGSNYPTFSRGKTIEVMMNVHDMPVGVPDKVFSENYKKLNERGCGAQDRSKCLTGCTSGFYPWYGAEDRDLYYFRPAILGLCRMVDYAAGLKEFDGKSFNVMGHSQGGGMSLVVSSLKQGIVTSTYATVPGMCDHAGYSVGREAGWPWMVGAIAGDPRKDPQVAKRRAQLNRDLTGYYDACFLVRRIKNPVAIVCGMIDFICVPSSVIAAYNNIPAGHKKIVYDFNHGHAVSEKACQEARAWLKLEVEKR